MSGWEILIVVAIIYAIVNQAYLKSKKIRKFQFGDSFPDLEFVYPKNNKNTNAKG